MRYPHLTNIQPVLDAIQGVPGIVASRTPHGYNVVDYQYILPGETFRDITTLTPEAATNELLRRECRGIKYNNHGDIIARPYHKFFNIGEMDETHPDRISINGEHSPLYLSKLDGSMIHPTYLPNTSPLHTRKGQNDVSAQANRFIDDQPNYHRFIADTRQAGYTPIFEWCTPQNTIVLHHDTDELIITNIRHIASGDYLSPQERDRWAHDHHIPTAPIHTIEADNTHALIDKIREDKDIEGYILVLDGLFYKVKTKDYMEKHRSFNILYTKNGVLRAILHGEEDDIIPTVNAIHQQRIRDYAHVVHTNIRQSMQAYIDAHTFIQHPQQYSKKDYVPQLHASNIPKILHGPLIMHYTDQNIMKNITQHVAKNFIKRDSRNALINALNIPTWKP